MELRFAALIALAACGDTWGVADAPGLPDQEPALVRLHVLADERASASGHRVFFQNVDSQLVLATSTNDDGRANAFMRSGGSVTLVVQDDISATLYTVLDVTTEDEVVLDLRGTPKTTPREILVRIPEDPGAIFYELYSSCGTAGVTGAEFELVSAVLRDCRDRSDLLVRSSSELGGGNFLFQNDVAIPEGARVTFAGAYKPGVVPTVAVQHVPLDIRSVLVSQRLISEGATVYPAGGLAASRFIELTDEGAGDGALSEPLPLFPQATIATWVEAQERTRAGAINVVTWGPPAAAVSIDFTGLDQRRYLTRPSYSATANLVGWIEGDHGRLPDAVHAELSWFNPRSGRSASWHVVGPRTEDAWITAPVLPDPDLQPVDPQVVELTSLSVEGGYARLRELPVMLTLRPLLESPSGRVVYQNLGQGVILPD